MINWTVLPDIIVSTERARYKIIIIINPLKRIPPTSYNLLYAEWDIHETIRFKIIFVFYPSQPGWVTGACAYITLSLPVLCCYVIEELPSAARATEYNGNTCLARPGYISSWSLSWLLPTSHRIRPGYTYSLGSHLFWYLLSVECNNTFFCSISLWGCFYEYVFPQKHYKRRGRAGLFTKDKR